jgi:hypothetical protein
MIKRFAQVAMLTLVMGGAAVLADAADDNLAEDNFLTNTINSVFEKVNKVASGEEPILVKDYNKSDKKAPDYTTDALGRKIQEPTIRTTGSLPPAKDEKATPSADKKTE